jgi:hypothetical protein
LRSISEIEREIGALMAQVTKLRWERRAAEIIAGRNERANSPRVKAIRNAYTSGEASVAEVARQFNTSAGYVQRLARELDWPRRSPLKCRSQSARREIEVVERGRA